MIINDTLTIYMNHVPFILKSLYARLKLLHAMWQAVIDINKLVKLL